MAFSALGITEGIDRRAWSWCLQDYLSVGRYVSSEAETSLHGMMFLSPRPMVPGSADNLG